MYWQSSSLFLSLDNGKGNDFRTQSPSRVCMHTENDVVTMESTVDLINIHGDNPVVMYQHAQGFYTKFDDLHHK